jgi:hypothetical protein
VKATTILLVSATFAGLVALGGLFGQELDSLVGMSSDVLGGETRVEDRARSSGARAAKKRLRELSKDTDI